MPPLPNMTLAVGAALAVNAAAGLGAAPIKLKVGAVVKERAPGEGADKPLKDGRLGPPKEGVVKVGTCATGAEEAKLGRAELEALFC